MDPRLGACLRSRLGSRPDLRSRPGASLLLNRARVRAEAPRTSLLRPGEGFAPSSYRLACSFGGRFWPRNRVLARGRSEKGGSVYRDQALCWQISEVGGQKARNGAYFVPERGFVAIFGPFRCTSALSGARTCGHADIWARGHAWARGYADMRARAHAWSRR